MTLGPRGPIAAGPTHPDELDEEAFQSLLGPWAAPSPSEVAELFTGASFRWWLVGGWALELAGAPPWPHKDTDISFSLEDLPLFRSFAQATSLDVWAPMPDRYRPILPGTRVDPDEEQFWVRRDAGSPWLLDVLTTPCDDDVWVFKKDHRIRRPHDQAIRVSPTGIPHLAPEIVLLHKATQRDAPVDRPAAVDELLGDAEREWLALSLRAIRPDHPWLT